MPCHTDVSRLSALDAPRSAPGGKPAFLRSASPMTRSAIGGGAPAPCGPSGSEAEASPEGIVFRDDHDLVSVDFIGGDGAEGSIPCLKDDDRDHERGGEGGVRRRVHLCGTSVWLLSWRRGTIPRATGPRRPEDWLTSPGAFGSPESTRRHGLARSPTPRGLISKTGFGARKGMASGGWSPNVRSRLSR